MHIVVTWEAEPNASAEIPIPKGFLTESRLLTRSLLEAIVLETEPYSLGRASGEIQGLACPLTV